MIKIKDWCIYYLDCGLQYCFYVYIDLLKVNQIGISMVVVGNCYENVIVERINGILKLEFVLD